jgi:hypothetical protein
MTLAFGKIVAMRDRSSPLASRAVMLSPMTFKMLSSVIATKYHPIIRRAIDDGILFIIGRMEYPVFFDFTHANPL